MTAAVEIVHYERAVSASHFNWTIGTNATQLTGAPIMAKGWLLLNVGTAVIYIGKSTVTTGAGFALPQYGYYGGPELQDPSILWAICGSSNGDLRAIGLK